MGDYHEGTEPGSYFMPSQKTRTPAKAASQGGAGESLLGSIGELTATNLVRLVNGEVSADELGGNYNRGPASSVSVQVDEESFDLLKGALAHTRPR